MKNFYLLRHEDVHNNSGTGVVAEGVIFDSGLAAMTWISPYSSVTVFENVKIIKKIHGHLGKTEVIIEGQDCRYAECRSRARRIQSKKKRKRK